MRYLLAEELEDEETLGMLAEVREEQHDMFTKRSDEGYFKILIANHLRSDEKLI